MAAGVPLISFYGTTGEFSLVLSPISPSSPARETILLTHPVRSETGGLLSSRRDCKSDSSWNWLRVEGLIADYIEMAPRGSDNFEVIVKDGWPAKIGKCELDTLSPYTSVTFSLRLVHIYLRTRLTRTDNLYSLQQGGRGLLHQRPHASTLRA